MSEMTERQAEIDVSNLRFYAEMFNQHQWSTVVLHWTVFEQTLREIADRIEHNHHPASTPDAQSKQTTSDEHPLDEPLGEIHETAIWLAHQGFHDSASRIAKAHGRIEAWAMHSDQQT